MKIEVIAIGKKSPSWLKNGIEEYQRRMPQELCIAVKEIPLPKRTKSTPSEHCIKVEAEKIKGALAPDSRTVAMDLKGKAWSTEELAGHLTRWMLDYQSVQFVVGGPDGLARDIVASADDVWSLSRLTFPHAFVPVLITEQLYRAWTIINRHPYHR